MKIELVAKNRFGAIMSEYEFESDDFRNSPELAKVINYMNGMQRNPYVAFIDIYEDTVFQGTIR